VDRAALFAFVRRGRQDNRKLLRLTERQARDGEKVSDGLHAAAELGESLRRRRLNLEAGFLPQGNLIPAR
jgi:hypothetical protein